MRKPRVWTGLLKSPWVSHSKTHSINYLMYNEATRNSRTRNFKHLWSIHKRVLVAWNKEDADKNLPIGKWKLVAPKDRIKWWNIVPGDQVRVIGLESEGVHVVHAINRFANMVTLSRKTPPVRLLDISMVILL
jgi:hypothetical protein